MGAGLEPSYTLMSTGCGALGFPHLRAGCLCLGPAGASGHSCPPSSRGAERHRASTYGVVTSCLQGPPGVQPSCRSLVGGPRSLWDVQVTSAGWAGLGRAVMDCFFLRAQHSAGQQDTKEHWIRSPPGPGTLTQKASGLQLHHGSCGRGLQTRPHAPSQSRVEEPQACALEEGEFLATKCQALG